MSVSFRDWPVNKQFMRRLVKPDTWYLQGVTMDNAQSQPHVVVGDEVALIIDTTDLDLDLRAYVEENFPDKKLAVACTHSHGDHTENNYQFADCPIYMTQIAWEEVQASKKNPRPNGQWSHPLNYEPVIIGDGDIIDLGGRQIECLKFAGCHSASSIVYLDLKYGCLFTGDEFEGGQVLIMGARGNNCIELYRDNCVALKEKIAGRATCVCPPHNGSPIDIQILDNMIENCEQIMAGREGMEDIRSFTFGLNPHGYAIGGFVNDDVRRSEWKGTSIVYNKKRIFYKDCEA